MKNNAIYLTLITKNSSNNGKSFLDTNKSVLLNFSKQCIKSIRELGKFNGIVVLFTDLKDKKELEIFEPYNIKIINIDNTELNNINYAPNFTRVLVDKIYNFDIFDKVLYLDTDIIVTGDLTPVFDQINEDFLYYVAEKGMFMHNEWCNLDFTSEEIEKFKNHTGINSGTFGCLGKNLSNYLETWRKETKDNYWYKRGDQPFLNSIIFRFKVNSKMFHNAVKFPHYEEMYDPNCPIMHFCGKKDDDMIKKWEKNLIKYNLVENKKMSNKNNAIYLTLITKFSQNNDNTLFGTNKSFLINFTEKCIKSIRTLGKFDGSILLFTDLKDENELKFINAYNVDIIDIDNTKLKNIDHGPAFTRLLVDKIFNFNIFDKVLYMDIDTLVIKDINLIMDQIKEDGFYYIKEINGTNLLEASFYCSNLTEEEKEKFKNEKGINSGTYGCLGKNLSQYMEAWRKETGYSYWHHGNQPTFDSMILRDRISTIPIINDNLIGYTHTNYNGGNCVILHFNGTKSTEFTQLVSLWNYYLDQHDLQTNREQGVNISLGLDLMSTWLFKLNKTTPIKTVVDFGCGAGKIGKMLRGTLKLDKLVGVDIWTPTLVSRQLDDPKIYDEVIKFDIRNLIKGDTPFDNYDLWFFGNILEHIEETTAAYILFSTKPKFIAARMCIGNWEQGALYGNEAERHLWNFFPVHLNDTNLQSIKKINHVANVTYPYIAQTYCIPETIENINHYDIYEKMFKAYISNFILSKK